MSASRKLGVVTMCLAAFVIVVWSVCAAEKSDHPATQEISNPFEGKMLIIRTDRAIDERDAYLQKAHLQTVGGEQFLVGKGINLSPKWKSYENRTIWVATRHIEQMYEFDSVEDINKMYEKSDD